jgi:hypothetical protein
MTHRQLSIALFGNMNNYPLLLAQGLRELGHRVRLLVNRRDLLHRPEARYPEWEKAYPDWIFDCSNITDEDIAYQSREMDEVVLHLTHKVDFVILNDSGPALACHLVSPHAVLLTGSDLSYYADFASLQMRSSMWDPSFKRSSQGRRYLRVFADMVARQRDGIAGADLICYAQRGLEPAGDMMLDQMGVQDEQRHMLYFSNTVDLRFREPPKNQALTILSGSRIVYLPHRHPHFSAIDFKGTNVLLNGFAQYVRQGGGGILRLPRKGQDLNEAEKLINQLGIRSRVDWLPEMSLAGFYEEMAKADLICDQFGTSFPGMVTTDAYALGRPVMADLRNDVFSQRFPIPLPGLNVQTAEQIARTLLTVERDRSLLHAAGIEGHTFAQTYLAPSNMAQELLNRLFRS